MTSGKGEASEKGRLQIRAGLELVTWSRLAHRDHETRMLVAAEEGVFESEVGHYAVHPEFGRLVCWIAFGVGAEYVARGACLIGGLEREIIEKKRTFDVLQAPTYGADLEAWVAQTKRKDSLVWEKRPGFRTLGSLPIDKIVSLGQERDRVAASMKLLASAIRNRDVHQYVQNVRALQFYTVGALFVPALNSLLRSCALDAYFS